MATRALGRVGALAAAVLLVVSGCSSDSDADEATEKELAEQLVSAAHKAGLVPRLTVEVAESMYGTDAPAVCDVYEDGLSTAEKNVILGNPAQGRRKTITDDAVAYGAIVVQTYCPDVLPEYQDAVADLDPYEKSDS